MLILRAHIGSVLISFKPLIAANANGPYTEFTLMHDSNVELLPGVLPLSDQDGVTDSALAAGLLGDQEIACKIISQKKGLD